MVNLYLCGTWS